MLACLKIKLVYFQSIVVRGANEAPAKAAEAFILFLYSLKVPLFIERHQNKKVFMSKTIIVDGLFPGFN